MEKFFKRREKNKQKPAEEKRKNNVESAIESVPKKKGSSEYRNGKLIGYTPSNTPDLVKAMQKRPPKGDWRKFDKVEIKTTTLVQKWTNKENKKTYEVRYISPWGTKMQ